MDTSPQPNLQNEREKTHTNKIREIKDNITTDTTEIQRIR
jgi:hypothetical protein